MSTKRTTQFRSVAVWSIIVVGAAAVAGPLNPPPGPVASTGKTLSQTEPRVLIDSVPITISVPGSYYLGADLEGSGGITITTSNVTIDLAGFSLRGKPGSTGDGIRSNGPIESVTIFNGTISDWPGDGIDIGSTTGASLDSISSNTNGGSGFIVGTNATVTNCTASGNGGSGIGGSDNGKVSGSSAIDNANDGFALGSDSTIDTSLASGNGNDGVVVGTGATVTSCTANDNKRGFGVGDASLIVNSVAARNSANGFETGVAAEVRSCNSTANKGVGFSIGRSASVIESTAGFNDSHGFLLQLGSIARGNSARENKQTGFLVPGESSGVVIERNQAFGNIGPGIDILGDRCLIISNVASQNSTDFVIKGSNAFGEVISVGGEGQFSVPNSFANLRY